MANNIICKKSTIHGDGVFASRDIKKGETVFIFKGKIVHWTVSDEKTSSYGPNWIGISKNTWLDVLTPGVHTNHSCEPTCGIKGRLKVVALRDIEKDEEITIDYSITEIDILWQMSCRCGAKSCRRLIRSIQFLPEKIYNKYNPYIPTNFMKVYEKTHNDK